jgi:hypothetical protein
LPLNFSFRIFVIHLNYMNIPIWPLISTQMIVNESRCDGTCEVVCALLRQKFRISGSGTPQRITGPMDGQIWRSTNPKDLHTEIWQSHCSAPIQSLRTF